MKKYDRGELLSNEFNEVTDDMILMISVIHLIQRNAPMRTGDGAVT